MYKTVSIHPDTYENIQTVAKQLNKPKAQVIDLLVKRYIENMQYKEAKELKKHNDFVNDQAKRIKLPKGTKIDFSDIDKEFAYITDL